MKSIIATVTLTLMMAGCGGSPAPSYDLLIAGGNVYDGSGAAGRVADIGIRDGSIAFIGDAKPHQAERVVDASGLIVAPGFIDMHSHAELHLDYGRDAAPYLFQGITTGVLGVDGGGSVDIAAQMDQWSSGGIGINALTYVGHGQIRREVMGNDDRAPTPDELQQMRDLVRGAMDAGAFGLSTGLFYTPGTYADTDEVIELTRVAAGYPGALYDTHDRDLGAAYRGVGYDASVQEGIRIAEATGIRAIFSHYNLQGSHNAGRADVAARYINDARRRGVDVWAAQHPYTATQSSLRAYTIPPWAFAGGQEAMLARFADPSIREEISAATDEMLETRGGADKILLVDERPGLNGITLLQYAQLHELPVDAAVREILAGGNATVMNLDLYDAANTRQLATEPWMMTCTDGRTPKPEQTIAHPRTFGAFPMKYRLYTRDEPLLDLATLLRGFSGLAADFLGLPDRGYLREGYRADVVVFDPDKYSDQATYESPQELAAGMRYVLVNGRLAIDEGLLTTNLGGEVIRRPGVKQPAADRVLLNGRIFTVDDERPWAEAVVVRNGRFAFVGDSAGALAMAGGGANVTDLGGRMVIPGLVDAHTHPGGMGRYAEPGTLDTSSKPALLESIRDYANDNPDLDWIEMCCWPLSMFDMGRKGPHKRDLDAVVADRPLWLVSDIQHSIWVNSAALELMGIDRDTPDPHPGVSMYVRDENGEATGWVKEKASRKYRLAFFDVDERRNRAGIHRFLMHLRDLGVTTLMDGGNSYYSDQVYGWLAEMDAAGRLPVRIEGTHHLFLPGQHRSAVADLNKLQRKYAGNRLTINTVKIHFDGSNENRTGAVLEDYSDDPGNRGDTVLDTAGLTAFIGELNDAKIDLHLHTVGDRAVRIALDATAAAREAAGGDLYTRVALSHLDIIDPEDYARFRPLNITAQYTPFWHGSNFDDPTRAALGEERYARTLIARPLFDDGANVSFSSDVTSLAGIGVSNPFLGMQIAHNRQYPQDSATAAWGPAVPRGPASEQLPLEMVIRAFTLGGAYQLRREHDLGSIETGKIADLVVLDKNLFEVDRNDIQHVRPSAVMMDGDIVAGQLP